MQRVAVATRQKNQCLKPYPYIYIDIFTLLDRIPFWHFLDLVYFACGRQKNDTNTHAQTFQCCFIHFGCGRQNLKTDTLAFASVLSCKHTRIQANNHVWRSETLKNVQPSHSSRFCGCWLQKTNIFWGGSKMTGPSLCRHCWRLFLHTAPPQVMSPAASLRTSWQSLLPSYEDVTVSKSHSLNEQRQKGHVNVRICTPGSSSIRTCSCMFPVVQTPQVNLVQLAH